MNAILFIVGGSNLAFAYCSLIEKRYALASVNLFVGVFCIVGSLM